MKRSKEIIQWTETQNKLCGYIDKDPDKPIVDAGLYLRSFPFFPKETADQLENDIPAENLYGMAVAAAVKAMNYHAGQETWALMPLATVSPAKLTSTFIKKLRLRTSTTSSPWHPRTSRRAARPAAVSGLMLSASATGSRTICRFVS